MRSHFRYSLCMALALMAAAPAVAQPADPIQQFTVRIVDVPRNEALAALPATAFDGEAHPMKAQVVARLIESTRAFPVNSFGGSASDEILISEDERTIAFKLTEGERTEHGVRIGYVAEFTENDVSKVLKGSGVVAPDDLLVTIEDGEDPEVTRLTVITAG